MSTDPGSPVRLPPAAAKAVREREASWASAHASAQAWKKDPQLWPKAPPAEVPDRLGWLDLPQMMRASLPDLQKFASEVRSEGLDRVVLLGMGGSSLAPSVLRQVFGHAPGFPELCVLDSTHPAAVRALADPARLPRTLFLVSSKSGTTLEPNVFHEFFWGQMEKTGIPPGSHFVAISDEGSALDRLARQKGFRRTFHPLSTVGGRYSALTFFGLVPAALLGADVGGLLDRAASMARACGPSVDPPSNPALHLGALMGELARAGQDKLTLYVGGALRAFPIWVEQLIAESTGKLGTGIVPVAGEALVASSLYGKDRFFVELQQQGRQDEALRAHTESLERDGHPVLRLTYGDPLDLGGEFFRWEFAVAMSGSVLGIDPFDQPDVEVAKELARQAMARGSGPAGAEPVPRIDVKDGPELEGSLRGWLAGIRPGDYVTLQAYLDTTAAAEEALEGLRTQLLRRTRVATTSGFGPRFLHSTGQLHKGGPPSVVVLQLLDRPSVDLPVPGEKFSFGEIIRAQSLGDAQVLLQRHRRVLRLDLGANALEGLERLRSVLTKLPEAPAREVGALSGPAST
ncbi:MAG: glucose-6-phosphate isomerase [Euryarchaeota archaeon]|nr:glucose-6-phosphate isomerase [Euryarchaeota archaeon]MDE1836967.1 glucose-6-phosphate isomerase [Euryarchaeota archaeon]MDE1880787.1 glucose-6-phosphate isomerase [Euryarchaeota archaeon]MDE2045848.1 glucose-6-phosphate isomerase [Thermoplasmata archaeon]